MKKVCKNKQLLWIGSIEEDDEFKNKVKKGYDQTSAQLAQKGMISGVEEVTKLVFDSINGSVIQPYPTYKEKVVNRIVWKHKSHSKDVSVGFKNIKYVNRILCRYEMIKESKRWIASRYLGDELTIFVYSLRSAPMKTAIYFKKRIPNAKIVLVVTDLPMFMDLGQSKIKKILKLIDWKSIKKMIPQIDKFILYAEGMASFLGIPKDRYIVMEGFYNLTQQSNIDNNSKKQNAILYAGMLSLQYGLDVLLNSFMKIENPDIELWLAGSGNAEQYIKDCIKHDDRIKYYGLISRNEVINLQKSASALINMRLPSNDVSKYSFPSKIFEYMMSGNPTISFKLEGIPKEYYSNMIIVDNEYELKNTLEKVYSMSEEQRIKLGKEAQQFIMKNKTISVQCKKICDFIWN